MGEALDVSKYDAEQNRWTRTAYLPRQSGVVGLCRQRRICLQFWSLHWRSVSSPLGGLPSDETRRALDDLLVRVRVKGFN
jgi:hypothetical protein